MKTPLKKLRTVAPLLVLLAALLAALPAGAHAPPDHFDPNLVNVDLQAGESTTVNKELHLTGLPAKADIIVAIDTTGSMGPAIAQAQADAVNICNNVQGAIPGARFAVVDFEDYPPPEGPGQAGDDAYQLKTAGFTASCADFSAAIGTMAAAPGSGGDAPEAYNRVNYEAYSDAVITASRDPQATQFLVALGDAEPHSAVSFGSCPAEPPSDLGPNEMDDGGGGDDLDTPETIAGLNANDITLLMIRYVHSFTSVTLACYEDMAGATGGDAVDSSDAGEIDDFIIANAEETPYTVDLAVGGQCPPVGLSFSPAPPYGPFSGPQNILFTETITAPTVPGDYTCTVNAVLTPGGPTTAVETINVRVTPGPPATLTLSPKTDTNTVDEQHCVTAHVEDEFGNPTPGITVRFSVSGSVNTSGSAVTDANGDATFCYTGPALPGADVITAYADTDNDGVQDPDEPSDTATKQWVIPASTEGCKVTYGGRITAANGDKATFGGNAQAPTKGQEQYQDHGPAQPRNVHSIDVQAVVCSRDKTAASIFGQATIEGAGTFNYRIDLTDVDEPGRNDTYRIRLSDGYDSGVQTLEKGGNVQIHK